MDDIVKQAMAKWPNVPHCHGWLGLDGRGNWYMRDDLAQSLGPFQSGNSGAKGSLLRHEKLIDFIQRNYGADEWGQWYFQNGPQRVYVELEAAPHVWRVNPDASVRSHTGEEAQVVSCLTDERGLLYMVCTLSSAGHVLGLVHTQDVLHASEPIEQGTWRLTDANSHDLEAMYGFVRSPEKRKREHHA
jgi:hypothetical protein